MSSLADDILDESAVNLDNLSLNNSPYFDQDIKQTSNKILNQNLLESTSSSLIQSKSEETKDIEDNISVKNQDNDKKKREVYRFKTDWLVSSLAWMNGTTETFQLAISSFIEDYSNRVMIVSLAQDDYYEEIECISTFEHPYPATKIQWCPKTTDFGFNKLPTNLLATSADYLRLWRVVANDNSQTKTSTNIYATRQSSILNDNHPIQSEQVEVKLEHLLDANKGIKHCTPLTSFDWNDIDPSIIATASVDTTCAIWDIEVGQLVNQVNNNTNSVGNSTTNQNFKCNLRNQIVAHNHEVYDISFSRAGSGRDIFVSAGGDGTIRMFDLRQLSSSTLLYEVNSDFNARRTGFKPSDNKALVRVSCNKQNSNLISAFSINNSEILIIDARNPGTPMGILKNHSAQVNSMSWAPHSAHHICTVSDDQQALIWELSKLPEPIEEPLLAYRANGKINVASWSATQPDWIAIGYENYLELLRV